MRRCRRVAGVGAADYGGQADLKNTWRSRTGNTPG
jgi:hypothetical protein